MPVVFRAQKRELDSLELKLQMIVSCRVGSGNRTGRTANVLVS